MVGFGRSAALITAAAAAAVLASCTSSGVGDWTPPPHRPSQSTPAPKPAGPEFAEPGVVDDVLAAAKSAVVAINTYDYRHLDKAVAAAKDHTTGKFRTRIADGYETVLHAQIKRAKAVQETAVGDAGLIVLGPKGVRADVLVGGRLRTAKANADPTARPFTTVLELTLVHHRWLASGQHAPDGTHGAPPGNAALRDAFAAAKQHVPALYTIQLKHFDKDYDHLLTLTTGDARDAMSKRRDAIQTTMTRDETDYRGKLAALAVTSVSGGDLHVFAVVDAYPEWNGVKGAVRTLQIDVTLIRSGDKWLISKLGTAGETG